MKLMIEIDEESYLKSYLSVLTIGILDCIEKKVLTFDEASEILFSPAMIGLLNDRFPNISEFIHLGTELEDVANLVPQKLEESIAEIRERSYQSIGLNDDNEWHIRYRLTE